MLYKNSFIPSIFVNFNGKNWPFRIKSLKIDEKNGCGPGNFDSFVNGDRQIANGTIVFIVYNWIVVRSAMVILTLRVVRPIPC